MTVHLLANPKSGRALRSSAIGQETLSRILADQHVIELTRDSAVASSTALANAVGAGAVERLIVAGGDGLVHLAIQQLAQTGIPMSIVPVGTGNDFAMGVQRASGPMSPAGTIEVDLLRVTTADGAQRWVASIVIAGFPAAVNKRANAIALPLGPALYTVAAVAELPSYRRQEIAYELTGSDETISRMTDTGMVAIGNSCFFGGGMLACPDAIPDDGLLHFTSIEGVGRIGILQHIQRQKGGTANWDEVQRHSGTEITLTTPDVELWGDGEYLGQTPATIEVVPKALMLMQTVA